MEKLFTKARVFTDEEPIPIEFLANAVLQQKHNHILQFYTVSKTHSKFVIGTK